MAGEHPRTAERDRASSHHLGWTGIEGRSARPGSADNNAAGQGASRCSRGREGHAWHAPGNGTKTDCFSFGASSVDRRRPERGRGSPRNEAFYIAIADAKARHPNFPHRSIAATFSSIPEQEHRKPWSHRSLYAAG